MGKHLTVSERLNAEKEYEENKKKIESLREERNNLIYHRKDKDRTILLRFQIKKLIDRNARLRQYMSYSKKSGKGLCSKDSELYSMFGDITLKELTPFQKRLYFAKKQAESRERKKLKK